MDAKQISKLIASDGARVAKIAEQRAYMEGRNVAILGRKAHEEPDNRISIPIVKKAVTIVSGYMAGEDSIQLSTKDKAPRGGLPGVVDKVKKVLTGKADYYTDVLKPIFDANDAGLSTHEEFETACAHGYTYEYHYTKDGEARFVEVPPEQCIAIWDDSLPPKLAGMVRYFSTKSLETDDEKKEAVYWDALEIVYYEGKEWTDLAETKREPHAYGEVPWAIGKINRNGANLFDHVKSIIDFRDRIVSEDWANELQRFATSFLLLANRLSSEIDESGQSEVDKLKITRTFEDLGENVKSKVDFLIKTIPSDFIDKADQLFERLSYDMMMLFDNKDMATTGQISGISLAYKLLPFEYASKVYEAYFSRFIQWRIRLIQNVTGNLKAKPQDRPQIDLKFVRNLPFDLQSAIDMFMKVSPAQLPLRVALKLLPSTLVTDIEATAKEMENGMGGMSLDDEIPGETGPDGSPMPAGDNVQAQALNGAQVASLVTVAQAVADNQLPLATAVEIVLVAMPTLTREDAMRMLQPADAFTPDKAEVIAPASGQPNKLAQSSKP
jgi:SPP1 family phage portal protein